jgi:hypothetical protein
VRNTADLTLLLEVDTFLEWTNKFNYEWPVFMFERKVVTKAASDIGIFCVTLESIYDFSMDEKRSVAASS